MKNSENDNDIVLNYIKTFLESTAGNTVEPDEDFISVTAEVIIVITDDLNVINTGIYSRFCWKNSCKTLQSVFCLNQVS